TDGDPMQAPVTMKGAALATAGHSPAILQLLVVRPKLAHRAPGHLDQLFPGHGVPESKGRIRAGTQEKVAAVAKAQLVHLVYVPLQDLQRLSRVPRVPEVNGVVRTPGREYLAVAPPCQGQHPASVLELRQLLAIAQVAEL